MSPAASSVARISICVLAFVNLFQPPMPVADETTGGSPMIFAACMNAVWTTDDVTSRRSSRLRDVSLASSGKRAASGAPSPKTASEDIRNMRAAIASRAALAGCFV